MKRKIDKIKNYFEIYRYAIFSSVIFTFLAHLYYFSSRFANEDDTNLLFHNERMLSSGRWSTGTFFTGITQVPMIKFIIVIVCFSIITLLICDMFKIKKRRNMVLIALIISTFPCLSMSFSYLFMVEIYMISLFAAIMAVYITVKCRLGFLLGSVLLSISLGNYQSYIGVAAGVSIIYLIKMILDGEDLKNVLKMLVKLLAMGILGVILYFIILKIYLKVFNQKLSTYKGADSMGIPPLSSWPLLLKRTYKHLVGYFLGTNFYKSSILIVVINLLLTLFSFIVILLKMKRNKFKNWWALLLFIALMPLAINIVDFVAYKANLSILNIYQFFLLYVFVITLFEDLDGQKLKYSSYLTVLTIIMLIIIGYNNFQITNRYYVKVQEFYEYTESLTLRLLTRIENTDGFDYGTPVMFVGKKDSQFYNILFDVDYYSDVLGYDQALWGQFIGFEDLYYFDLQYKIIQFIEYRHGINLLSVSYEEKEKIKQSKEFNNMETWPSQESIKIIDGVLVVNF